eukprot:TRINITY_DN9572_c0_g1_i2.p1 TRINITY_DN9572_c0_g1~~TRINITY_DN9572_c0_g1_i2.p1  ORF type:complete len:369 (+),score=64.25 TRINITY_DN9572_c0_g1_i2:205-1311(+)
MFFGRPGGGPHDAGPHAGGPMGSSSGGFPVDAFQMLFGAGGIGQHAADGGFMGMGPMFGGMQPGNTGNHQADAQGSSSGRQPTAAATLRSLPKIKVTAYDIEVNESTECAICLDELVVGQPALRIVCGHLYHEDCVKDWLKKSNECPVCRYELPIDDAQQERERRKRMEGRKLRMRRKDLTQKSAQELRRLADHICVNVTGCLEKGEYVDRIANSSQVQIIPCDGDPTDENTDEPCGLLIYSQSQLDAMSLAETQALMNRMGVAFCDCANDKAGMIQRLVDSGRLVVSATTCDLEMGDATAGASAPAATADRGATATASEDFATCSLTGRSVKELRNIASRLGVSLDGCLEKGEMVDRIQAVQHRASV